MTVRIAHFSDTHVLSLEGIGPRRFLNKRWTGAINLALNRSRHYRVEIFERLLQAVHDEVPDHSVCTGDLVNLALEPEFVRVSEMLEQVFTADGLTVVPGNHDYYAKDAVNGGLFERWFNKFQPREGVEGPGQYPVVRVLDEVFIVGLSTAIPTPVFMATGRVTADQLAGAEAAFRRPEAQDRFRLLLLHHPLFPEPKRPLDGMRRLTNAGDVLKMIARLGDAAPQLVVHGHNHEFKRMATAQGVPVIQVGSASRSGKHHRAEFNVYVIEDRQLARIERHIHQPDTGGFLACAEDGVPLERREAS